MCHTAPVPKALEGGSPACSELRVDGQRVVVGGRAVTDNHEPSDRG
jgi:hypothetical protein